MLMASTKKETTSYVAFEKTAFLETELQNGTFGAGQRELQLISGNITVAAAVDHLAGVTGRGQGDAAGAVFRGAVD